MARINFTAVGDQVVATGDNWEFLKKGNITSFRQTGKTPPIRVIKVLLKKLIKASEVNLNKEKE